MGSFNTDIKSVNHANMDIKAKEIRAKAVEMNDNLTKAYDIMKKLYSDNNWRGNRYNKVAEAFNKQTECLNDILRTTVTDIPFAIEVASNNYSSADGTGRPHQEIKKTIAQIQKLSTSGETETLTYLPNAVHTSQNSIVEYINKAKADLESIIQIYGEVKWKTDGASIAFKKQLDQSRAKIDTAIKEVTKIINEQIDESDKAMASSEESSTVTGSNA